VQGFEYRPPSRFESKGTVIALCNLTMNFVQPWLDRGFRVVMVDPQHEKTVDDGRVLKIASTVLDAMDLLRQVIRHEEIVFGAAFPPCTDMAVSGARWFEEKRKKDPQFQSKAVAVAEQCRTILRLTGAPYFIENPRSILSRVFGKADFEFHPWQFVDYCADDNYTKTTCLWTGNGFKMPLRLEKPKGSPDDRIHKCPPGDERANIRSATPRGFSFAVCEANDPWIDPFSG
jgi:hypothetical protein